MIEYTNIPDIYFNDNYAKLYEQIENGKACKICVDNENGSIESHVILRKIPIALDKQYYDIVTPYGYGGPIITSLRGNKDELIKNFCSEMESFVCKNNVVSEFVRFHPVLRNALDFKSIYNSEFNRKTAGTNVRDYEIEEEFSKSVKKNIKRAQNAGVSYEIVENPNEVEEFKKVYYSTMDRDKADDYYYFNDEYFDKCLKTLGKNVLYVKVYFDHKVIAAGFYFICGEILECHLSGTLSEYLHLSPAYITKIATARWAKDHNVHFIHYGGGTTPDEDNSLYQFKKKFGLHTEFDFHIGKKIWNQKIYDELCRKCGVDEYSKYFPAYRMYCDRHY
jgi:hypothetical protein